MYIGKVGDLRVLLNILKTLALKCKLLGPFRLYLKLLLDLQELTVQLLKLHLRVHRRVQSTDAPLLNPIFIIGKRIHLHLQAAIGFRKVAPMLRWVLQLGLATLHI